MKRKAAGRAIVACARELWDRRLVTGSSGNLSARLADGSILITPTGRAFRALDARELVRIDPQTGASLEDPPSTGDAEPSGVSSRGAFGLLQPVVEDAKKSAAA